MDLVDDDSDGATAVSKRSTCTRPKSLAYQSSQTAARKVPQSSGSTDQSVTTESGAPGFACGVPTRGSFAVSQCCGATLRNATGSTPEISCTRQAPNSRVRKR